MPYLGEIADRIRNDIYDDPSIVRHIHDLAILKSSIINNKSFGTLVLRALDEDKNRSKNNLSYVNQNLEDKLNNMIDILKNDKEYSTEYKYFVETMSYASHDTTPSYKMAVESLEEITEKILNIE